MDSEFLIIWFFGSITVGLIVFAVGYSCGYKVARRVYDRIMQDMMFREQQARADLVTILTGRGREELN